MKNRLFTSFKDAFEGVRYAFFHEPNFRIQIFFGLLAMLLAVIFPLKGSERLLIVILTFMVLVIELLNTAIEKFIDLLKPRLHHYAKIVKDVMAGAVFLTVLGAVIVGLIIFIPYFIVFISRLVN
jgi:diacylglycerol kinase